VEANGFVAVTRVLLLDTKKKKKKEEEEEEEKEDDNEDVPQQKMKERCCCAGVRRRLQPRNAATAKPKRHPAIPFRFPFRPCCCLFFALCALLSLLPGCFCF
jgi:hypothetical protein